MARLHPRRRAVALLAAIAAAALAGCATAPGESTPRSLPGVSGQQQAYVQPLPPPPPTSTWGAEQVVLAFLQANASFELDPSAARQYLGAGVRWRPSGSVTVVSPSLTVNTLSTNAGKLAGQQLSTVTVKGTRLATLTSGGQYSYQPGNASYQFSLVRESGIYKIQKPLPEGGALLLTQTTFDEVFQPRNLYFFGRQQGSTGYLVPDPVFAPVQSPTVASTTSLASELVRGLFFDPGSSWLSGATRTAFLSGTRLIGVTISNQTAVVNLSGEAALAKPAVLAQMLAQLRETLTSSSYSAPLVQHVELATDGKIRRHLPQVRPVVPAVGGKPQGALYFAAAGRVYQGSAKPTTVPAPGPLLATPEITALAVSSGGPRLAVAVSGDGCTVYAANAAGSARPYTSYRLGGKNGGCTSLSWGAGSSLWAVAGSRMWFLQSGQVQEVGLPTSSLTPRGTQVQALTVAPDGIRVALLLRPPGSHRRLVLGAPTSSTVTNRLRLPTSRMTLQVVPVGTSLTTPAAVSWYKPDELLALDGFELYEVPLTGGQPAQLGTIQASHVASIATTGSAVALRTAGGVIYTSPGPSGPWTRVRSPIELGPAVLPG
jgi:hypothetical protein